MKLKEKNTVIDDYLKWKSLIVNNIPFIMESLKKENIKAALIRDSLKDDFSALLKKLSSTAAFYLFDDVGVEMLSKSFNRLDKMHYIMMYGQAYIFNLFDNPNFCSLIIEHFNELAQYLCMLNYECAFKLMNYIKVSHLDYFIKVFAKLDSKIQQELLPQLNIPVEILNNLVLDSNGDVAEYLLKNDARITTFNDLSFHQLLLLFSKKCQLPNHLCQEQVLVQKVSTMESVKDYRFLMNALVSNNDTSVFERARKRYYKREFESFNIKAGMLDRYYRCYLELVALMRHRTSNVTQAEDIINKYFNFFGSDTSIANLRKTIIDLYVSRNQKKLELFFIEESRLQISNMIIDYHFEDVPYNFFLNIRQLCRFQQGEGRTLSDEDLDIYTSLLDLDNATYEEQMRIHQRLSQEDFMSKHYDIFRGAKDKASSLISECILNQETIQGFLDKDMSLEYDVPVYVLDGQEFYALVKATSKAKYHSLEPDDLLSMVDGASYSLDGSGKLDTYRKPEMYFNLIFSDFPIKQVIHMYPVDSYSEYTRGQATATTRVYELLTPKQMVEKSENYNEIVLAQPNTLKPEDDLNNYLKMPTLLGLYCYDTITEYDVKSAKNLGVGIVLVKTKSYKIDKNGRMAMRDTMSSPSNRSYINGFDYFDNVDADDMASRRLIKR